MRENSITLALLSSCPTVPLPTAWLLSPLYHERAVRGARAELTTLSGDVSVALLFQFLLVFILVLNVAEIPTLEFPLLSVSRTILSSGFSPAHLSILEGWGWRSGRGVLSLFLCCLHTVDVFQDSLQVSLFHLQTL